MSDQHYFPIANIKAAAERRRARRAQRLALVSSHPFLETHPLRKLVIADKSAQESLELDDLAGQGVAGQLPVEGSIRADEILHFDSEAPQSVVGQDDGGGDDALQ